MIAENKIIENIVSRYGGEVGMLIPMMQDLQAQCGYLQAEQLRQLAENLDLPLTRLFSVATFYSSFRLAPKGSHDVTLCVGTVCHLKGAGEISKMICQEYNVEPGGTTQDGLFSFQPVNCVGACALAPVIIVDGKYHDGVTKDSVKELLDALTPQEDAQPEPAGRDRS